MAGRVITIPYTPRPLQREIHAQRKRFNVLVCHRRFGKTVLAINELIRSISKCRKPRPRMGYIAPLYRQAKSVAWDYLKHYTRPIPGYRAYENELRVDLGDDARISLFGADNPDSLRGLYFDGVVLDEYAQMSERLWSEIIRPAIADRGGWVMVIGTPAGEDEFHRLYHAAADDDEWLARIYRASETGILPATELAQARAQMSDARYLQEFECSWAAAVIGSYYGGLIEDAEQEGRIGDVSHDPAAPVETWWDLGIGDSTSIWWAQRVGTEVHVIDHYEASGQPLAHYVRVLKERESERKMNYGDHVLPHDAKARELISGKSREQALRELGIKPTILEAHRVEDGIEAVRMMLPRTWFDRTRCADGLRALRQYRAEYDDKRRVLRPRPLHDWSSHAADAFRQGAMHRPRRRDFFSRDLAYDNRWIV